MKREILVFFSRLKSGAHNPAEPPTPILGLCYGVFTEWFIFRHILGHFFPQNPKWNLFHFYERIRSIRSMID